VKAARETGNFLAFFLTANELAQSCALPNYHFYLVLGAETLKPTVLTMRASQLDTGALTPMNFLVALERSDRQLNT
jgi:hypothetical protein